MECDVKGNPWSVRKIEEFLYFCCPECELTKDSLYQSRELFLKHAINQHPGAKENLPMLTEIKLEPNQDDSNIT